VLHTMSQDADAAMNSRSHCRIWFPFLSCLGIGAVAVALVFFIAKHGNLPKTRTHFGGQVFALWMQEEDDEVWVCAQQNPGWLRSGTYSTSIFVVADSKTAAEFGPSFHVPVVPRRNWNQADIRIDKATATVRFMLGKAEILLDLKSLDFGDPYEVSVDAAQLEHGR